MGGGNFNWNVKLTRFGQVLHKTASQIVKVGPLPLGRMLAGLRLATRRVDSGGTEARADLSTSMGNALSNILSIACIRASSRDGSSTVASVRVPKGHLVPPCHALARPPERWSRFLTPHPPHERPNAPAVSPSRFAFAGCGDQLVARPYGGKQAMRTSRRLVGALALINCAR